MKVFDYVLFQRVNPRITKAVAFPLYISVTYGGKTHRIPRRFFSSVSRFLSGPTISEGTMKWFNAGSPSN
jgi:hypothetical protein